MICTDSVIGTWEVVYVDAKACMGNISNGSGSVVVVKFMKVNGAKAISQII